MLHLSLSLLSAILVFEDFQSHSFIGGYLPALGDHSKGAAPQDSLHLIVSGAGGDQASDHDPQGLVGSHGAR